MKIRILLVTALPVLALAPVAQAEGRPAIGLAVSGTADHRRPIPGEVQNIRWTVRNLGARKIDRAWLDTAVPPGWRLDDADGCEVSGRRLHCGLGPLERGWKTTVALRMTTPRPARLAPVRLRATTGFEAGGQAYEGPATAMRLTPVRHR